MIEVIHRPLQSFHNHYVVFAESIEDAIAEMLPRIRKQSQVFYEAKIREDLGKAGSAFVDQHAGSGSIYTINLSEAWFEPLNFIKNENSN